MEAAALISPLIIVVYMIVMAALDDWDGNFNWTQLWLTIILVLWFALVFLGCVIR